MARLIVKSPYIKCGGGQGAGGYMKYIATRERVAIIPDDRPPTRKQEQLITKLANDFPDTKNLLEYEDYIGCPTKANASSLITLALEENWSQVQPRKAMPSTSLPGPALSVWVTMDYLAMKMAWIWTKPCLNWSTTQDIRRVKRKLLSRPTTFQPKQGQQTSQAAMLGAALGDFTRHP